jgi:hypothetical protein
VGYHLEDVIAAHGPGKVKDGVATAGVVDFVSVDENEALARGNRPNERHVVFFTATSRAGLTAGESLRIGESKAPKKKARSSRNTTLTVRFGSMGIARVPNRSSPRSHPLSNGPVTRNNATQHNTDCLFPNTNNLAVSVRTEASHEDKVVVPEARRTIGRDVSSSQCVYRSLPPKSQSDTFVEYEAIRGYRSPP